MGTVGARARVAKGAYVTGELTGSYQKPSQIVTFWGECVCHICRLAAEGPFRPDTQQNSIDRKGPSQDCTFLSPRRLHSDTERASEYDFRGSGCVRKSQLIDQVCKSVEKCKDSGLYGTSASVPTAAILAVLFCRPKGRQKNPRCSSSPRVLHSERYRR